MSETRESSLASFTFSPVNVVASFISEKSLLYAFFIMKALADKARPEGFWVKLQQRSFITNAWTNGTRMLNISLVNGSQGD